MNIIKNNISSRADCATSTPGREIGRRLGRAFSPSLALLAAAFLIASCGGSDTAATPPSPFQGSFAGNWTSNGTNAGTAQVTVSPGGAFKGSVVDTTINRTGSVVGALNNDGTFQGTVQFQGQQNPVTASGKFAISKDSNTLSGNLDNGGIHYMYTLTRQQAQ